MNTVITNIDCLDNSYAAVLDAENIDVPDYLEKDRNSRVNRRKNRKSAISKRLKKLYTHVYPIEEWTDVQNFIIDGNTDAAERYVNKIKGIMAKRAPFGQSYEDVGMRDYFNHKPKDISKLNACEDQLKENDAWACATKKKRMSMQVGKRCKIRYGSATNGSVNHEKLAKDYMEKRFANTSWRYYGGLDDNRRIIREQNEKRARCKEELEHRIDALLATAIDENGEPISDNVLLRRIDEINGEINTLQSEYDKIHNAYENTSEEIKIAIKTKQNETFHTLLEERSIIFQKEMDVCHQIQEKEDEINNLEDIMFWRKMRSEG